MLARPIRRSAYLLGRWLGLAVVVAAYAAASGLLEVAAVGILTGHTPPEPLLAVVFLAAQAVTLLTIAILLSTRIPAIAAGAVVRRRCSGWPGWPASLGALPASSTPTPSPR